MVTFKIAESAQEFETGKTLFLRYAKALDIDLSFQNFEAELEKIDQQYSQPEGALVLVYSSDQKAIGCFGIRKLEIDICELKRMYLIDAYRKKGLGSPMIKEAIKIGKELGYQKMRLDTLPSMKAAISLYEKHGFYEIESYRFNPFGDAKYYEKNLSN